MEIKELIERSHNNAKKKGFYDKEFNLERQLILVISEVCEAVEADRKNKYALINDIKSYNNTYAKVESEESLKNYFEKYIKNTFEDEIADCFIRLGDLCGKMNIDIEEFIKAKIQYNETRPHKHGKKY